MNQQDDKGFLKGWPAIRDYLGLDRKTIIRRGYQVFSIPFSNEVWAVKAELDEHTRRLQAMSMPVRKFEQGES